MLLYYLTHTDTLETLDVHPAVWGRFTHPHTGKRFRVTPLVVVGDGAPAALYSDASGREIIRRVDIVARRCPQGAALAWWVCSNLHPETMVSWGRPAEKTIFLDNLRRLRMRAQEIHASAIFFDAEDYRNTYSGSGGTMDQAKAWRPETLPLISAQDVGRALAARGLTLGYYVKSYEHWQRPPGVGRSHLANWTRLFAAAARAQARCRTLCLSEDFDVVVHPEFKRFLANGGVTWTPGFHPRGLGDRLPRDGWIFDSSIHPDQDQTLLKAAAENR